MLSRFSSLLVYVVAGMVISAAATPMGPPPDYIDEPKSHHPVPYYSNSYSPHLKYPQEKPYAKSYYHKDKVYAPRDDSPYPEPYTLESKQYPETNNSMPAPEKTEEKPMASMSYTEDKKNSEEKPNPESHPEEKKSPDGSNDDKGKDAKPDDKDHKSDDDKDHKSDDNKDHKSDDDKDHKSDDNKDHKPDDYKDHMADDKDHKSEDGKEQKSDDGKDHKSDYDSGKDYKSGDNQDHKSDDDKGHKSDENKDGKSDDKDRKADYDKEKNSKSYDDKGPMSDVNQLAEESVPSVPSLIPANIPVY